MIRIGVVGSRTYSNEAKVRKFIDMLPLDWEFVSGGCPDSVDTWAEEQARSRGMDVNIHYPLYTIYGKYATLMRNTLIVNDSDIIIAFWAPPGKGTKDTLKKAVQNKKPVFTIGLEDDLPTVEEILNKVPK